MDPKWKLYDADLGRIEKWVLRKAFDDEKEPYALTCQRQKEQFSDDVGYNWIDGLKAFTEQQFTDEMMKGAAEEYLYNTPINKEAYYYRMIFSCTRRWSRSSSPPSRAFTTSKAVVQQLDVKEKSTHVMCPSMERSSSSSRSMCPACGRY